MFDKFLKRVEQKTNNPSPTNKVEVSQTKTEPTKKTTMDDGQRNELKKVVSLYVTASNGLMFSDKGNKDYSAFKEIVATELYKLSELIEKKGKSIVPMLIELANEVITEDFKEYCENSGENISGEIIQASRERIITPIKMLSEI